MTADEKPSRRKVEPVDRGTYGGSPAAVFLVDLINVEVEKKSPNIGRFIRKYGNLHGEYHSALRDLEVAAERGALRHDTVWFLLKLVRNHMLASIEHVKPDTEGFDKRVFNLARNVLVGSYKVFARRMVSFSLAHHAQRKVQGRLANGQIDPYETVVHKGTGVVLLDDGELVKLTLRDFDSDREEREAQLWKRAKSISKG